MRRKIIVLLFILLFFRANSLIAVGEIIRIDDYSYKDGLTTSKVNSVYKDTKGFLWICSENGLFRFDGYDFRNINTLIKDFLTFETFCITEDDENNFLIGTSNGIYYYNTHTNRLFHLKLSTGNSFIVFNLMVVKDKIWAATTMGLLMIKSHTNFRSENIYPAQRLLPDSLNKRTPQDNIVNDLYYSNGSPSLWVGTNGALYEMDLKTHTFEYINSLNQNSIRGIAGYDSKIILSSWDGGVFTVNPSTHKLENDQFIDEINKVIGDKRVMSALFDKQKRLWVATFAHGLYIFEINSIGKLSYVNYRNDKSQEINLKTDFINQIYLDNTGIVWLSMNQPALSKVYFQANKLKSFNFQKQSKGINFKEILFICQSSDKNKLWITTNGSGIYLFDTEKHSYEQYNDKAINGLQLQNNEISFCYQDKRGNLWIVYRRIGLYVVPSKLAIGLLDGSVQTLIKPLDANKLVNGDAQINSYITCFSDDSSGRLWVGGWGSLYVIDQIPDISDKNSGEQLLSDSRSICVFADNTPGMVNFPITPVLSIVEISKNKYWLGTLGSGIIQINEVAKNQFSGNQLAINKKLSTNCINLIFKGKKKGVWIGTNAGLYHFDLITGKITQMLVENGLCSDNIKNVIEDHLLNIWVSTSYGISKINSKDFSISNYFSSNSEKENQYLTSSKSLNANGLICFATNESLVMINPDSIANQSFATPLYFTDVKIDNETVIPLEKYYGADYIIKSDINESEVINVPYNHTLSIEFAALNYWTTEQVSYKYKIGNSNDWIQLKPGQRNLTLPNMSSGEYTLTIKVANTDNSNNIRKIKINYLPPFWLSKTAYVIYGLVILGLLIIYRRLLIQKILQKSIIEKERFEIKKLEELDKMKSEFFSNISHEFRTPLSLIVNPLEKLAKEDEISTKNKERIKLILKSSNRLLKLTNELMDFSKIEKNLLIPDMKLCEIGAFVNEIGQLFNNLADTMNFDYKIHCSFDQQEIMIDTGMIEKVIFNLLSNAFKYTPANGMILVNLAKSKIETIEYIKLSVINTGEGINNENLGKIFDRYYQVNNVQNRNTEGTGIGLSLVKSFVELHNGKVEVISEPNLETSFDIYLPIVQKEFDEKPELLSETYHSKLKNSVPEQEAKNQISRPLYHYRLLVIEDDDDIRNFIIDELSTEFKILSAQNGEAGLKIANEIIPDLIITDVIMPVLSGHELCRKLKNQVVTSHIPILMLSAKTTVENQIEGLEMGADVYMIKPFSSDHLKAQIFRLISFKQAIYSRYLKETELIPQGALSNSLDEEFMKKVTEFIEKNLTNSDLNVDQLANCVSLSKVQTYRKIKAISGMSIVEFIRTIRLKKSMKMIIEGSLNFSEIAFETGFSSPSYFSKCFHDHFAKTPSDFASEFANSGNVKN